MRRRAVLNALITGIALSGCASPRNVAEGPTPLGARARPFLPDGYSWFRHSALKLSFAYPSNWSVDVAYGHSGECPSGSVVLTPPDDDELHSEASSCTPLGVPRLTTVTLEGHPDHHADPSACGGWLTNSPYSGSTYGLAERVYSTCGYEGQGDGAEACLQGAGRQVVIHMAPPSGGDDPVLRALVATLRFEP